VAQPAAREEAAREASGQAGDAGEITDESAPVAGEEMATVEAEGSTVQPMGEDAPEAVADSVESLDGVDGIASFGEENRVGGAPEVHLFSGGQGNTTDALENLDEVSDLRSKVPGDMIAEAASETVVEASEAAVEAVEELGNSTDVASESAPTQGPAPSPAPGLSALPIPASAVPLGGGGLPALGGLSGFPPQKAPGLGPMKGGLAPLGRPAAALPGLGGAKRLPAPGGLPET